MNDNEILTAVRDSFAGVRSDTSVDTVLAAGRARARRRALSGTAAAAVVAVAGLALALPAMSHPSAPSATRTSAGPAAVHVHLTAFALDSNADHTVTLVLSGKDWSDPTALEQALTKAGIRSKVTVGSLCLGPSLPQFAKVVVLQQQPAGVALTITPAAMPKGSLLSFTFRQGNGFATGGIRLVSASSPMTCPGKGDPTNKPGADGSITTPPTGH
jgi:hypothetical protein